MASYSMQGKWTGTTYTVYVGEGRSRMDANCPLGRQSPHHPYRSCINGCWPRRRDLPRGPLWWVALRARMVMARCEREAWTRYQRADRIEQFAKRMGGKP